MDIRVLTEEDLGELLALCVRALPLDRWSLRLLHDRIFDEPEHRPEYQLAAWEDGDLVGVMLSGERETPEGTAAAVRLFATAPERRRQGVAEQLLAETEARLRAAGRPRLTVGGHAPIFFWPGLDVRYTEAYCFLEKHGFARVSDAVNMTVNLPAHNWDTAAQEELLAREGFVVRRLEEGDRERFEEWMLATWGTTWQAEATAAYQYDPVSAFIALQDGEILSFAAYGGTAFENGFGPTGTDESLRGLGIGRVLFHRCMHDLVRLGHSECEVIWVGPIAFYARVADARISRVFWVLEKAL